MLFTQDKENNNIYMTELNWHI